MCVCRCVYVVRYSGVVVGVCVVCACVVRYSGVVVVCVCVCVCVCSKMFM